MNYSSEKKQTSTSVYVLPSTSKIALSLFAVALVMALISLLGAYIRNFTDYNSLHRYIHHAIDKTNLDAEVNIPTFYSACLLLLSSILAGLARFVESPYKTKPYQWFALSALLFLLSMDEAANLHEFLNTSTIKTSVTNIKFLYWTWVIPGALATLIAFIFFIPFLRALPLRTAKLMVTAGAVYVGGAIGLEMIGSAMWVDNGGRSLSYMIVSHLEELSEMSGLIIFIYTLLDYFSVKNRRVNLYFASSQAVQQTYRSAQHSE